MRFGSSIKETQDSDFTFQNKEENADYKNAIGRFQTTKTQPAVVRVNAPLPGIIRHGPVQSRSHSHRLQVALLQQRQLIVRNLVSML